MPAPSLIVSRQRMVVVLILYILRPHNSAAYPFEEGSVKIREDRDSLDYHTLPPCETIGEQIKHNNRTCVYISPHDVSNKKNDVSNNGDSYIRIRDDIMGVPRTSTVSTRGGSKSPASKGSGPRPRGHPSDPYERDGKYWLVPPFLIGASSVIVVYIIVHCLYLHCYAKRKMKQLVRRAATPPHIMLSDGDGPSCSSVQHFTPMVKYEGAYGKTEVVEAHPFLIYHDEIDDDEESGVSESVLSPRRKSSHLQLPHFFNRKALGRSSVSSAGSVLETSQCNTNGSDSKRELRKPRASICFIPVGRTFSDPSGSQPDFTPLQGFVYSAMGMESSTSLGVPGGGAAASSNSTNNPKEDATTAQSPIIILSPGSNPQPPSSNPEEGTVNKTQASAPKKQAAGPLPRQKSFTEQRPKYQDIQFLFRHKSFTDPSRKK